jgi:hypothetical protein
MFAQPHEGRDIVVVIIVHSCVLGNPLGTPLGTTLGTP